MTLSEFVQLAFITVLDESLFSQLTQILYRSLNFRQTQPDSVPVLQSTEQTKGYAAWANHI